MPPKPVRVVCGVTLLLLPGAAAAEWNSRYPKIAGVGWGAAARESSALRATVADPHTPPAPAQIFALSAGRPQGEVRFSFPSLERRGNVVAAVFDSEASWRARSGAVRTATASAAEGRVVFGGLPPGRYAAMVFHDVNGDGKLNTLPIGLPVEPYGFSRNARGRFGPPAWGAAAFDVTVAPVVQTIRLR